MIPSSSWVSPGWTPRTRSFATPTSVTMSTIGAGPANVAPGAAVPVPGARSPSSGVPTSHHRRLPAVDHQGRTVDERSFLRGEEGVGGRDLVGATSTPERDLLPLIGLDPRLVFEPSVERGIDEARAEAVDPDARGPELDRHRSGELEDPAFRRVVGGEELLAAERVRGRHVHDRAARAVGRHQAADGAGDEEHPAAVDRYRP